MEFLYLYILIGIGFGSLFFVLALKILDRRNALLRAEDSVLDKWINEKEYEIERSGTGITLEQYFLMSLVSPAVLCFAVYVTGVGAPFLFLPAMILGVFFPKFILQIIKGREDDRYSDRFSSALNQMAASLNAGLSFEQAIDAVISSELVHRQVRDDFRHLSADIKLGVPVTKAFYSYADRTQNEDVYDVATAVSIMLEIGRDEGTGIRQIQKNIEDRMLYRKKRKAALAESKALVYAADIIPVIVVITMVLGTPDIINAYMASSGMTVLFIGILVWVMIGSVVVHRIMLPKKNHSTREFDQKGGSAK